jgi:hypothetical protein
MAPLSSKTVSELCLPRSRLITPLDRCHRLTPPPSVIHVEGCIRRPFEVCILTQLLPLLSLHEILIGLVDWLALHLSNQLVLRTSCRSNTTYSSSPSDGGLTQCHDPSKQVVHIFQLIAAARSTSDKGGRSARLALQLEELIDHATSSTATPTPTVCARATCSSGSGSSSIFLVTILVTFVVHLSLRPLGDDIFNHIRVAE